MARYTRHPIRDETTLVRSREACLQGSDVVPIKFWTAPHAATFDGLLTMSREQSLQQYGHAHIHGTLDGVPVIVQEWLGCEALPFRRGAWLFHPNTPATALVVLRGNGSVTVERMRAHVRATREWAAWRAEEGGAQPFVPFPGVGGSAK